MYGEKIEINFYPVVVRVFVFLTDVMSEKYYECGRQLKKQESFDYIIL